MSQDTKETQQQTNVLPSELNIFVIRRAVNR